MDSINVQAVKVGVTKRRCTIRNKTSSGIAWHRRSKDRVTINKSICTTSLQNVQHTHKQVSHFAENFTTASITFILYSVTLVV